MADAQAPICFHCGQAARTDKFNRLEDGRACPACSERLLATLAPLLPGGARIPEPEFAADALHEREYDGDIPA